MDARTIIAKIRDGVEVSGEELGWFARGLADGRVTDAQAGAFAMAVCVRGLSEQGRVALTGAMRDSGEVLAWALPGPVIDKHSTGGVGDCVSLPLAPALAACGGFVPMVSGRGLGHTGGTLDKLEAIPGFTVGQSEESFRRIVAGVGCAIVSASCEMAPADRRLYAIRDVTGTVESVDLITASILSKKLAAGLDALVLDVKTGSGAFMADYDQAMKLARALVSAANGAGTKTSALVTDMSQPLAASAGNAVEVAETCRLLRGETSLESPLGTLVIELGAKLLMLAEMAGGLAEARKMVATALTNGRAAEKFAAMVAAQGGPVDFLERWRDWLREAPVVVEVPSPCEGFVVEMNTRELGEVVVALGGGRLREDDAVDPTVGLSGIVRLGDRVVRGQPLALVHAASEPAAAAAVERVLAAMRVEEERPASLPPLIHGEVV